MSARPRHALYAQSGGVTAVINVSAQAVIETARAHPGHFARLYAGRNGILGVLDEDLIDTGAESAGAIAALRHTPGGAFGSCRYKLKGLDQHRSEYERLIAVLRAHDIGTFFYNGGGDSADTCLKVAQIGRELGYPLQAIHIPKTMDNDLPLTDCCPGFGSVAKYSAVSIREAGLDVASMAASSTQVFILEVMGRHAGWTAAAGGLAATRAGEAPQLILFPEIVFDEDRFLAAVEASVKRWGYCAIVASEGLRDAENRFLSEAGGSDAFGHAQLGGLAPLLAQRIKQRLGRKCHYAVADYLMRAARHIASATDVEQAYAVGRAAVEQAMAGASGVMVTIERLADSPYRWTTGTAPLEQVANVERKMPRDFITADGFHITEACRRYLLPLIAGEDYPPYADGLPLHTELANTAVPRQLPPRRL
ncbi:MAG: 6-phosphofructokinase [Sinimarinibacterium flocculans]|uniref:6-phosphofructokinase n=1 Tax=Sinimarinibacterium flocculans TaxID=985250 RepID=UPI003C323C25